MASVSTFGFGGSGVSFSKDKIASGNSGFTTEGLEGALGTELAQGTFAIDDGLIAFDSSPVFTADSGALSDAFNTNQSLLAEQSTEQSTSAVPPSTRPYIWKYQ